MTTASTCNVGALLSQSICERVISAGNIDMADGNTVFDSDGYMEIMKWAPATYAHLDHGDFRSSIIPEKENEEKEEELNEL